LLLEKLTIECGMKHFEQFELVCFPVVKTIKELIG
jgi:hypothetical protein